MKVLETIKDVENEGLMALIGKDVMIMCVNYIYAGKLIGVNSSCIKLENAHIVYETGAFSDKLYKDAQPLVTSTHYVQISAIESFGLGKKL